MPQKKNKLNILVLNGPNLNLLGKREPEIYGRESLKDIDKLIRTRAKTISKERGVDIAITFNQSNSEADLISWIGSAMGVYDGIIINPAALTHTSIGLLDAIKATGLPCVEAHLSNIHAREDFRKNCVTTSGCVGQVMGFRSTSYLLALEGLIDYILRSHKCR
ncbi:MAG: type II 3-dehydroquinate dehydratase [bacterium]